MGSQVPLQVNQKLEMASAFICIYKSEGAVYNEVSTGTKIVLTIKQAGLLAMETFSRLITIAATRPEPLYLLTPLTGAIFSRDGIIEIAGITGKGVIKVLKIVNESC